jgi:hypothetical protein
VFLFGKGRADSQCGLNQKLTFALRKGSPIHFILTDSAQTTERVMKIFLKRGKILLPK